MSQDFSVRIEPHGRTVPVAPGQALLEAALAAGLNLPHSCKSGHCGSCRARLLAGTVDYPAGRPLGITPEEQENGYILLCQARAREDVAVEARLIASVGDVEIKTLPCRIARLDLLAPDVMQVWLRLPASSPCNSRPASTWTCCWKAAGAAASPSPVPRMTASCWSCTCGASAAAASPVSCSVIPPPGPALAEGALLRIEGPVGQFTYRPGAAPLLMIAGGTGFAPLKSMLRHVLETGIPRDVHLYWGARHVRDLYEEALVLEWVRRYPQLRFTAVLSEASPLRPRTSAPASCTRRCSPTTHRLPAWRSTPLVPRR